MFINLKEVFFFFYFCILNSNNFKLAIVFFKEKMGKKCNCCFYVIRGVCRHRAAPERNLKLDKTRIQKKIRIIFHFLIHIFFTLLKSVGKNIYAY